MSTQRPVRAGELCDCGRPAVVVYVTDDHGDVPWCGLNDGGAKPPEQPTSTVEQYVWPGGHEAFAVMDDGEVLCIPCVNDRSNPTHTGGEGDGWRVDGYSHMGETDETGVRCAHCYRVIE